VDAVDRQIAPKLLARVRKTRGRGKHPPFILDVDLEIPAGITILFGPSGAGKSTLLDCIAGLVRPDAGNICSAGRTLFDSAASVNLPPHRRKIAYVFQSLALFPHLTVEENVGFGIVDLPDQERAGRVAEILAAFRVADLRKRQPAEISGGEAQRVELARALVTDPQALLLDEPMSGLDDDLKAEIIEDLRSWRAARNIPILYVTHSRSEAGLLGEHMVTLRDGQISGSRTEDPKRAEP
jgi:molybdate transport system ATP-binding protein